MRIFTEDHKKKLRESLKGRAVWNKGKKGLQVAWNKGIGMKESSKEKMSGKNNYGWKGDEVGYWGIHKWIQRHFGSASHCSFDNEHTGVFEWANVSGGYRRDIGDWTQLCAKCHRDYDNLLRGVYPRDSKTGRFYSGSAYFGVGNKFA